VARCPGCGRFFCRECVSEHEDRMICASCLAKITGAPARRKAGLIRIARFAQFGLGFLMIWLFFYFLGKGLLEIPSAFHKTTSHKIYSIAH